MGWDEAHEPVSAACAVIAWGCKYRLVLVRVRGFCQQEHVTEACLHNCTVLIGGVLSGVYVAAGYRSDWPLLFRTGSVCVFAGLPC